MINEMKKILIVIPSLSKPGGIASVFSTLKLNQQSNIEYFYFNSTNRFIPKFFVLLYKYFTFILSCYRYEIIHINPPLNKRGFWRDIFFVLISRLYSKKVIIHYHGENEKFYNRILYSNLLKKIYRNTFGNIDISILLGVVFIDKYRKIGMTTKNNIVLPNPVNFKDIRIKKSIEKRDTINLLFLARIDYLKGTDIAIETMRILNKRFKNRFLLNICGDGVLYEDMRNMVNSNNIENIIFHGYVKGEDKKNAFDKNDIFFFPTCYGEGLPVSMLEAMYYGLPIISRKVGGIPDWVINNENGFITESKSPKLFAELLMELSNNYYIYEKMSKNNIEIARNNFTVEKVKNSLINIYQSIN